MVKSIVKSEDEGAASTVTLKVVDLVAPVDCEAVTVIVDSPTDTPVTTPVFETVATAVLLLEYVKVGAGYYAFAGAYDALIS